MKNGKKQYLIVLIIFTMILTMMPGELNLAQEMKTSAATTSQAAKPAPTVTKKTLYVGYKNYTIQMKNLAKGSTVTYKSSNTKVAKVTSKGVISPVAKGTANITVTVVQSGKTYKSTIAVTVKNPYVWISNKVDTVTLGESYQFTGKTYGLSNTSVTWTSSNKKVATINSKTGKMTTVAPGTTTIKFKDKASGKTSTCKVTVEQGVDGLFLLRLYKNYLGNSKDSYNSNYTYTFIYLDNDTNPECIVWDSRGIPLFVMSYQGGKIVRSEDFSETDSYEDGYFFYTPKTGKFRFTGGVGRSGGGWNAYLYELKNSFSNLGYQQTEGSNPDGYSCEYVISSKRVTEDEFEKYYDSLKLKTEAKPYSSNMEEAYTALVGKDALVSNQVQFSGKTVAAKDAKVGDTVVFGSYEQDNNKSNGPEPIEWLVLDKKDGKLLLLSKYGLERKPYNEVEKAVTWETCTLRKWLNNEFYETAFSKKEQLSIATTELKNEDIIYYTNGRLVRNTPGGNDTTDKIFLLSSQEVMTYFNSDPEYNDPAREMELTKYAATQGYNAPGWWLRSPTEPLHAYETYYSSLGVYHGRVIMDLFFLVHGDSYSDPGTDLYARPALWLTLEP